MQGIHYFALLGPPPHTEQKSQKLKDKARKAAKEATALQNESDKQSSRPKYTLAIKDSIPLFAHVAVVTDKTIEIPIYFNVALDRVISVRSSFSQRLETVGRAVDQASDPPHNTFVIELERAGESLRGLVENDALDLSSSIKNAIPRTAGDRARQNGFRSLFEVLDVYEPSAAFLVTPDVVPPLECMELESTLEVSNDSFFEVSRAMTMLMDDLFRLRRIYYSKADLRNTEAGDCSPG